MHMNMGETPEEIEEEQPYQERGRGERRRDRGRRSRGERRDRRGRDESGNRDERRRSRDDRDRREARKPGESRGERLSERDRIERERKSEKDFFGDGSRDKSGAKEKTGKSWMKTETRLAVISRLFRRADAEKKKESSIKTCRTAQKRW